MSMAVTVYKKEEKGGGEGGGEEERRMGEKNQHLKWPMANDVSKMVTKEALGLIPPQRYQRH